MDEQLSDLVHEVERGRLSRRAFFEKALAAGLTTQAAFALLPTPPVAAAEPLSAAEAARVPDVAPRRWQRGRGWGWVWGDADELGALNELGPALTRKALGYAGRRVYDLGLEYDRRSFKFAGHSEGEIITYRTPLGLRLQGDVPTGSDNSTKTTYASCHNSISDNVATQIDGLGHIWVGTDPYAYNGFRARDVVGDYGVVRLGVETIPPIVAPATLIDVAGHLGEDALPAGFAIGPDLLRATLRAQHVDVDVLDVVLVRTGTAGVWLRGGGVGANHRQMASHDPAGITVAAARWLVEQKGALAVGSDTSGLEVVPPVDRLPEGTSFNPVHVYLLVQQGVHILEFHNCEDLAADGVHKFAYALAPNKIKGNVAGTVQRPLALA